VLLVPIEMMPDDIERVPPEADRVVLAHGEATGHAHAIEAVRASLWEARNGSRFLRVDRTCKLLHEEHDPIQLPPGAYRVIRQVEYVPGPVIARTVVD
jgi:hypothetical protein